MADLVPLTQAIEAGDRANAVRITTDAVADGMDPQVVLDAMIAAIGVVGTRFQAGDIFVPEMLISARAMKEATAPPTTCVPRSGSGSTPSGAAAG